MEHKKYLFPLSALIILGVAGVTSCEAIPIKGEVNDDLPPVTNLGDEVKTETVVKLEDIVSEKTTLHAKEKITLTCESEVTWSVSNDLAIISETGELTAGDKDGTFIVTATSKVNPSYSISKLFEIKTMSSKELASLLYEWAEGYNYTMDWTGKLLDEEGNEVDRNTIVELAGSSSDALLAYDDFVTKGNLAKYTNEGFYVKYGVDTEGTMYEGGVYNSPLYDGKVFNYDVINGQVTQGYPDYYSFALNISDYKDIYNQDLSIFMRDEFKVEDSNLILNEDCSALLYDTKKDQNNYRDISALSVDYSLPMALFYSIDSYYCSEFIDKGFFFDCTADIIYDEIGLTCVVSFKDLNLGLSTTNDYLVYDYQATFRVYDVGSTVIDGLLEMIEAEKNSLEA